MNGESKWQTAIIVDVISNGDSTYDTHIATECSSGAHYPALTADEIGRNVADLIETLNEANNN